MTKAEAMRHLQERHGRFAAVGIDQLVSRAVRMYDEDDIEAIAALLVDRDLEKAVALIGLLAIQANTELT